MRKIEKQSEPEVIIEYKNKQTEANLAINYEDFKEDLKNALLEEQGYICCYCTQRIEYSTMKVEHFKSRNKHPKLKAEYSNLLGACQGNEKLKSDNKKRHCDTCKDGDDFNDDFKNPAATDFDLKINYLEIKEKQYEEGKILVKANEFQIELNCNKEGGCYACKEENGKLRCQNKGVSKRACLNLNEIDLTKKRYRVWKAIESELSKITENQIAEVKRRIEKYQTKKDGKYDEFCEMVVYLLKK